ncbi:hypothetical protein DFH07DRAFT_397928, partial [Mycena maculata]
MSRLRARMESLEEDRASLSAYHSRNIGIFSPLRRMPSELISEIFSWTLSSIMEASCSSVNDSPWVLTHISSRWRAISLGTPSLWSRIVIRPGYHSILPMVEAQIQRAQKLRIYFFGTPIHSRRQRKLFELLSQHSSRWEHLFLQLSTKLVVLLPSLRDRLPSL